jgi:AraC-like DNA-binding protein
MGNILLHATARKAIQRGRQTGQSISEGEKMTSPAKREKHPFMHTSWKPRWYKDCLYTAYPDGNEFVRNWVGPYQPSMPFYVSNSGINECARNYAGSRSPTSQYNPFSVEYVVAGGAVLSGSNGEYFIGPGEVFIINPYHSPAWKTDDRAGFILKRYVEINGKEVAWIFKSLGLFDICSLTPRSSQRIVSLLKSANRLMENPRDSFAESCALAYRILVELSASVASQTYSMPVQRAMEFINSHLYTTVKNRDIADAANLSISRLSAVFSKELGCGPVDFFIRCKMEQAQLHLKRPDFSIKQVANMLGYDDQRYFTKVFRKNTGMSPTQYREKPGIRNGMGR